MDHVRLWLVMEEDRGMGISVVSGETSEQAAEARAGSNQYVDYVDLSPECVASLMSNVTHQARAGSPSPECAGSQEDKR